MSERIRIATRKSPLALWQAYWVKAELEKFHPELEVELVTMVSRGDKILDAPLAKIGGKGLFVKELEEAMLEDRADIAVHSMKDVPMEFPEGLELAVICEREDPRDAFVSNNYAHFTDLPEGAILGTSSLRRQAQLLRQRPDLKVNFLRGNVGTRLSKLDDGQYDAIVLAAAGLKRLELEDRITHEIPESVCLPAGGQGAVGIECRVGEERIKEILAPLQHDETAIRVTAERAVNKTLNGGCQVPIACYAVISDGKIALEARVADPDGSQMYQTQGALDLAPEFKNAMIQANAMGVALADDLLMQGAGDILDALYDGEAEPVETEFVEPSNKLS